MEITKDQSKFNSYTAKLSMGELEEIKARFENDHTGPVADEIFRAISWYLDGRLPGPGEEKEEVEGGEGTSKKADELLASPEDDVTFEPTEPEIEPEPEEPEPGLERE